MNIMCNGVPQTITAATLEHALTELGFTAPAIATAVNGVFVAALARAHYRLQPHDCLEIVAPMQGG